MSQAANEPSRGTIMWRGMTRRCPRCGSGKIFRRWMTIVSDCPKCSLHFERESGYWVGAQAINFICTGGALILAGSILFAFQVPNINIAVTLAVLAPIAVFVPIIGYPLSKSLWMAIDHAYLQRMDSHARPDE